MSSSNNRPSFVGENSTFRERGPEGEQSRLHLMGIEVYLGIDESAGELLYAVGWTTLRQLMGKVLRVVGRQGHPGLQLSWYTRAERF
jgi:hypothetical protein